VVVVGINPDYWSCIDIANSSVTSSIGINRIDPPIYGDRVICLVTILDVQYVSELENICNSDTVTRQTLSAIAILSILTLHDYS